MATQTLHEAAAEIIDRCRELARISDIAGQTTRTFLSPASRQAQALLSSWLEAAGLNVTIDRIGNLRARRPLHDGKRRLLIGSHLDTVIDAGPYDGVLGILIGLALAASTLYPIEVIAFSEEEGIRFRKPFLGSLSLIGEPAPETLTDADGLTLQQAIRNFGHTPTASSGISPDILAYLEFHIEQGPVLEALRRPLAAVSAIAGQTRLRLTFAGQANHAGTTPMPLRRDALAAAAQWISAVEEYALTRPGLVATVGSLTTEPNLGNVIPAKVYTSLDVRHSDDETCHTAVNFLTLAAHRFAAQRGVTLLTQIVLDQHAVLMDQTLTDHLQAAAGECGFDASPVISGAGHDAMIMARRVPAAMLFLRTPSGLSHHPDEAVLLEDVVAALATGNAFLSRLFPEEAACTD